METGWLAHSIPICDVLIGITQIERSYQSEDWALLVPTIGYYRIQKSSNADAER